MIKSISGIRGTIGGLQGDNLTPVDIVKFTSAYATWLRGENGGRRVTVVMGRDARLSGEMLDGIIEGTLLGCGADVINLGLCTTPGVELAVTTKGADGGIIITASHNPRQWNALKMLNGRGEFLSDADGKRILAISEREDMIYPSVDELGKVLERSAFNGEHIEKVLALPLVDAGAVKAKKYRVVVDAVNSVGGIVIPQLLERLGVETVCINCEPTGEFAHNPEPLAQNLTELCGRVISEGADMGISVDPDVDRLVFVREDGALFGEEYTLVAVADYVLSHTPGNTVSNLSSTRALRDVTERHGGKYFAVAVGEVNVVAEMKRVGAVIGGEGNGGVIYPESHYGRDALVGIALFLTHLARSGGSVSQLRAGYPEYFMAKKKIELTPGIDLDAILAKIKDKYTNERVTDIDGVKIEFPDEWVHLRKSNTEPIIRIYAESCDEVAAETLADRMIDQVKASV